MAARLIVGFTVMTLLASAACSRDRQRASAPNGEGDAKTAERPTNAAPARPDRPDSRVVITPAAGEPTTVYVEVVRSRNDIRHGLMFRQHLPADQGMLFLMGEEKIHTFWMKNTVIPLDMIFIKPDKTIAGIVENTVPLDKTTRYVDEPSLYVLEVNAGWSAKHGVAKGDKVEFVGIKE